jgi:glycosyltransferase involved in cell wall biosynthesis
MKDRIVLSYVITTRNKLRYLKIVLGNLIKQRNDDEEIIVVDGASTDGTPDYLQELLDTGLIQQFISEPDRGEAHGTNKGVLMARGELIKIITDDDAFYFPAVQKCKEFMLKHPAIDVLGTEGAGTFWQIDAPFGPSNYKIEFQEWLRSSKPFSFCGLGLMIRHTSLPLTGLFHTGFMRVDHEFALRLTAGPVNLAWYTGFVWVRIANLDSVSQNYEAIMNTEGERINHIYIPETRKDRRNYFFKPIRSIFIKINQLFKKIKTSITGIYITNSRNKAQEIDNWLAKVSLSRDWLLAENKKDGGIFLCRKS